MSFFLNVITGGRQVYEVEKQPFACAALSFCLTSSVLVLYVSADLGGAQGCFFLLHFLFVAKLFILSEQCILKYLHFPVYWWIWKENIFIQLGTDE